MKTQNGITLVSLIITIIVMLIVSFTIVRVSLDRFEINNLNKMNNDLELLADKVSNYYLKTGNIPVLLDSSGNKVQYTFTSLDFEKNNTVYYILDLEAMDGLLLNFGEEGFKNPNTSDDVYIINEQSHTIYYVKGIKVDDELYHFIEKSEADSSKIPPTNPQIITVNGELQKRDDDKDYYLGDVILEFVPGVSNNTEITETTYKINNEKEENISKLENNLCPLNNKTAKYIIELKTYGANGTVSITKKTIAIQGNIGAYVNYNVPYIDMYSGIEYTASNGWRYLGKDDNGNKLIISTAIPALLHYSCYTNTGNTEDGGKNSWWATKEELSSESTPSIYRTSTKTYSQEPNRYAAYGLRYKFEKIEFSYSETNENAVANEGIYRKIGTQESGKLSNTAFRANGVNIVDVHDLTLAELNRTINNVTGNTRADGAVNNIQFKSLTGSALGLFDMNKLENYTQGYWYWLSWPNVKNPNYMKPIFLLSSGGNDITSGDSRRYGVRPVITLSSDTKLADTNDDGILEIQ